MKYFFPLVVLAFNSASAVAQVSGRTPALSADSSRGPHLALGVALGPAAASFLGSDATNNQTARYKLGFHTGLTADLRLTKAVAFHPEVLYVIEGSNFANKALYRELTYVNVPLLARYYVNGMVGANTVFLEAGPQVSMLLKAQNDNNVDVYSDFKKVSADFILGVGYRFASGFSASIRYDVGVTKIYKKIPAASSGGRGDFQSNATNDVFLLSLGYTFPVH